MLTHAKNKKNSDMALAGKILYTRLNNYESHAKAADLDKLTVEHNKTKVECKLANIPKSIKVRSPVASTARYEADIATTQMETS